MSSFERFHGGLLLGSALFGVAVVATLIVVGRPRNGGVVVVATVAAAVLLGWEGFLSPAGCVALGVVAASTAACRQPDRRIVPWLGVISAAGVWAAVPDTEPALAVGAVLAVVVVGVRPAAAIVGDRLSLIVGIAVAAWAGARGRPEVVGGIACLGMLVVPGTDRSDRWATADTVTLVVHTAVVLVASRVITHVDHRWALLGVVLLLVVVGAAARVERRGQP